MKIWIVLYHPGDGRESSVHGVYRTRLDAQLECAIRNNPDPWANHWYTAEECEVQ